MKINVNVKITKKCAICKYWYDPTNSVIFPKNPKIGIWEITDTDKKSKCIKTNLNTRAGGMCSKYYECKL